MFSHFFIDRPIFATVLSVAITLVGGIAVLFLPIAQYPRITPPAIQVSISYPGANAQIVADTVAAPIEQQVTGVPGMLYMSSQSGNDGSYSLSVTFDVNTDLNTALVMVQNRVKLAMPLLPTPVQNQGITIRKRTPDILLIVNLFSPERKYDDLYLSNYALINARDELLRVDGVSDVNIGGQRDYSVRAWLDPQKLAALNMSAIDVTNALRAQNVEVPAGQVGQAPIVNGQSFQLPIATLGRLSEPEQFGDIIVKTGRRPMAAQSRAPPTPIHSGLELPGAGVFDPLRVASAIETPAEPASAPASAKNPSAIPQVINTTSPTTQTIGVATTSVSQVGGGATSTGGASTAGGATSANSTDTSTASAATDFAPAGGTSPSDSLASLTGALDAGTDNALEGLAMSSSSSGGSGGSGGGGSSVGPQPMSTAIVRLRDVARVELAAQNYNQACSFDGQPTVLLIVYQLPGTNALDVANRVRSKMEELAGRFPEGIRYDIAYDTTHFISESITDVIHTLVLAVLLVGVVVYAFLQSWRAVLIAMAAIPVAIVGTFSIMALAGFSLNNISLFGLVLAIGIVVDDAIVVVENVERWLDQGKEPREAARSAMQEVTGPIIAVALVLCTVFVPCAFISGITGRFFREFAITIAVSTMFSALNSLTLSPALAAILLKPRAAEHHARKGPFARVRHAFERVGSATVAGYGWIVGWLIRGSFIVFVIYAGLLVATYVVFDKTPAGFVPQQDQGRLFVGLQLPDSASIERTKAVLADVERITRSTKGVAHTISLAGLSFVQQASGSNFASLFVTLDPFEERRGPELHDEAILNVLRAAWRKEVKEGQVLAFSAPPVPGLSVAGGFKIMVEDKAGLGLETLQKKTDELVGKLQKQPGLTGVSTQFRSHTPQLFMDIDRTKVQALGVSFEDAFQTLQIYLGSLYVNSFNKFGRHWQFTVQADSRFRTDTTGINLFEVRNQQGRMVPLSTLVTLRETTGPIFVTRFNLATAAPITGGIQPGFSSGDVIAETEKLANQTLPRTMRFEWTELMFMQIREGNTAAYVFSLAVLCVFLTLAALYESWTLPLAAILVVPLCILCSLAGVWITQNSLNIFVQIGLVVLVGLACKNSILIVEFAKRLHEEGKPLREATEEASRLRLRPILMTSLAFILGVVPMVVATGAGAEMRRSLGTAVFSGMIGVTIFGIFLTPVFFHAMQGLGEVRWLADERTRRVGSSLVGALLGAIAGFLLAKLDVVWMAWGVAVGALGGAALLAALMELKVRTRGGAARTEEPQAGGDPLP